MTIDMFSGFFFRSLPLPPLSSPSAADRHSPLGRPAVVDPPSTRCARRRLRSNQRFAALAVRLFPWDETALTIIRRWRPATHARGRAEHQLRSSGFSPSVGRFVARCDRLSDIHEAIETLDELDESAATTADRRKKGYRRRRDTSVFLLPFATQILWNRLTHNVGSQRH